ncbi:MAG: lysine-sensitive aspartokinase 3 [Spirochaetales bacterium]|nr:lysine-sensitive aspartokinase 3 [Spirochaetales bacterium]
MKVLKFGGSSVRDPQMILRVIDIARACLGEAPILVSSAMGKTTDMLEAAAASAEAGERSRAEQLIDRIESDHVHAAKALSTGSEREPLMTAVATLSAELRSLIHGITLIRECSPRSMDAVLSFGERLSTTIIAAAARERGLNATLVDARTLIRTDASFTAASPDLEATTALVSDRLDPQPGSLIVTQGFIASTTEGVTTTLGRGGSDFTATILGAALGADVVEIWTDVDGIMTADPRVIDGARTIPAISYDEAAELAYFGAKVVHPYTILPAVQREIPVWVKNTSSPESPGTRITGQADGTGIRAVASKSGITLVTVRSSRMLNAYGFLRALFAVFDRHKVSVDLVATSEVSVSMTVDGDTGLGLLEHDLQELGQVEIERGKSIVCLVGRDLFERSGFVAEVFAAVDPAHVRLISLGASEINLSLVVDEGETEGVLRRLHEKLLAP